jgi:hypothetical protein
MTINNPPPSITYEGIDYSVPFPQYDRMVKRGLIDFYELSDDPDEWLVIEPFIFWSARIQKFIIAPRWFTTDLASIPKPVRNIISVNGYHRHAAICHDVLYTLADQGFCTKEEADLVFKDFMKLYRVPAWKQWSMYNAVKLGGRSSWEGKGKVYAPEGHKQFYCNVHTDKLQLTTEEGSFYGS